MDAEACDIKAVTGGREGSRMKTRPSSQESIAMAQTECPWCAGPAALVAEGPTVAPHALDCAECGVRVELAQDPVEARLARAA